MRVLQDGEFERVGGNTTLKTNARIIAATNRNLFDEVKAGRFREDLWYRLNVFPITLPPFGSGGRTSPCWCAISSRSTAAAWGAPCSR